MRHRPAEGASTVYHLRQADLRPVNSSSSSSEAEDQGPQAFRTRMSSQYHVSEGGESSQSAGQGPSREFSIASTTTERHLMKEQLQHVKAKLNTVSGPPSSSTPAPAVPGQLMGAPSLALPSSSVLVGPGQHLVHSQGGKSLGVPGGNQPGPLHTGSTAGGVEKLLEDIASRLSSIEGMYTDMSTKLVRVDHRTAENERTVRELQHISAGAINETARLVDIMVPGSNRGAAPLSLPRNAPPALTPPGKSRGRHATGHMVSTSPVPAAPPALDYLPAQVTSTVHQHSSQIHKLVAGLDFLEQHIMRQDQVIESVQKQLLLVSHEQEQSASSLMAPNEMALKLHDQSELVSKLRSHMYKVDKRVAGSESSIQMLSSQVEHLTLRLEMLEQSKATTPGGAAAGGLMGGQEAVYGRADIAALNDSHSALRQTVAMYGRDLYSLSTQVQQLVAGGGAGTPGAAHSAAAAQELQRDVQELKSQLEELRSDVSQDSCAATHTNEQLQQVQAETTVLKQRLEGVVESLQEQLRRLQREADQARTMTRSTSTSVPPDGINPAVVPAALERVQQNMEVLTEQLASLSGIVSERMAALSGDVNARLAGVKETHALDQSKWQDLSSEVKSLKDAVEGLAAESLASQSVIRASHRATTEALLTEVQQLKQDVTALSSNEAPDPVVVSSQLSAIVSQQTASLTALQVQIDNVRQDTTTSQASLQALLHQVDGQQQQLMQQVTDLLAQVVRERGGVEEALQAVKADLQGGLGGVLTQVQQCIEDMSKVTQQGISEARHKSQVETQQVSEEVAGLQRTVQTWQQSMRVVSDQVSDLAAKLDVDLGSQLSDLVAGNTSAHTALEQLSAALSRVVSELDSVKGTLGDCQARMGDLATQVQVVGVVSVVEELQVMCKETAVGLETVRNQLSRDYINHEKLGAIFAAREDMRSAVTKLEHVFAGGAINQNPLVGSPGVGSPAQLHAGPPSIKGSSHSFDPAWMACCLGLGVTLSRVMLMLPPVLWKPCLWGVTCVLLPLLAAAKQRASSSVPASAATSAAASPSKVSKVAGGGSDEVPVYDVSVNTELQELRSQVSELQAQLRLALYRSENSVRQEQLSSMQQAMITLELQLKEQQRKDNAPAARAEPLADVAARSADVEVVIQRELESIQGAAGRLKDLEQQVVALQKFSRRVAPVLSDDLPMLRKSVQDLQLMLFDLRGARLGVSKTPYGGNSTAGYAPSLSAERESSPGFDTIGVAEDVDEDVVVMGPGEEVGGLGATARQASGKKQVSLRSYHSFAAPDGNLASESSEEYKQEVQASQDVAALTTTVAQLSQQLVQIEAALSGRVQALEAGTVVQHVNEGLQAEVNRLSATVHQLQELPERVSELRDVVETIHLTVQPASPRPSRATGEFENAFSNRPYDSSATSSAVPPAVHESLEAVRSRLADVESRLEGLSASAEQALASGRSSHSSGRSSHSTSEITETLAWLSTRLLEIDAQAMSQAATLTQLSTSSATTDQVDALKDALHKLVDHVTSLSSLITQKSGQAGATGSQEPGQATSSGTAAVGEDVRGRLQQLEVGLSQLGDNYASLSHALAVAGCEVTITLDGSSSPDATDAGQALGGALRGLLSKVSQVEQAVQSLKAAAAAGGARGGLGDSSGAAGVGGMSLGSEGASSLDGLALANMEGRMAEYGKVLQAMRNRIVALQEYVDSTQGMVKELHTVHGSVLMRLSALESSGGGSASAGGGAAVEGLRQVQVDLQSLESKFLAFHASQAQLSASLEALKRVGDKLADLDARDGEIADKVAAIGQTMPVIAGQLKTLERSLQARLTACCTQLQGLSSVLAEISRMEKQDSKNPFSGIGGAGNNPVVKLLEAKVELLRNALANVAQALATEFKNQDGQF